MNMKHDAEIISQGNDLCRTAKSWDKNSMVWIRAAYKTYTCTILYRDLKEDYYGNLSFAICNVLIKEMFWPEINFAAGACSAFCKRRMTSTEQRARALNIYVFSVMASKPPNTRVTLILTSNTRAHLPYFSSAHI